MTRAEISSHGERADRYREDPSDRMYEDDLRKCRREGHVQTIEVCPRCGESLGTIEKDGLE